MEKLSQIEESYGSSDYSYTTENNLNESVLNKLSEEILNLPSI